MRPATWTSWGIVAATAIVTALLYPSLPAQMATHWNAAGEVNGTMGRFWGSFLIPIMLAGLAAIFLAIPRIDPLRKNIESFRGTYDVFVVAMLAFLALVHAQVIAWNLGIHISPNATLPVGIALLYGLLGHVMRKAKRNYFIGIRTPWTLSSDAVWDRTHALGSKLFTAGAVITLFGLFWPLQAVWFVVAPAIAIAIVTIVYSYVAYRQLER